MPIALSRLREAATRPWPELAKSLTEARQLGLKTAFLCHSHLDAELVIGMVRILGDSGWNVYVDWKDASMPPSPNRETARKIKDRIKLANFFLFLATPNSTASRWCPWEIGYADGVKQIDSIFVITTSDASGNHYGNEYLQLYRHVDFSDTGSLAAWMPGESKGTLVRTL
jgi:TIR domain-containing protein